MHLKTLFKVITVICLLLILAFLVLFLLNNILAFYIFLALTLVALATQCFLAGLLHVAMSRRHHYEYQRTKASMRLYFLLTAGAMVFYLGYFSTYLYIIFR